MTRWIRCLLVLALAVSAVACSRGPASPQLAQDVQARLDAQFGRTVLAVEALKRQGGAPYRAADDGARRVIVYYNASLKFREAYDPSDWEKLSPQLLATALGAGDEGIVGLRTDRLEAGATLRAYGSIVYRREGDSWRAVEAGLPAAAVVAGPAELEGQARANALMNRLSEMASRAGARGRDGDIVAEELDRALQMIRLRMDAGDQQTVVAAGPEGGEYSRFVNALRARQRVGIPLRAATTEGSVENVRLVDAGKARFGIVQSDVAAAAITGAGVFSADGPLAHVRAVASLFPEPLHVVVRADSRIHSMTDLAGASVSIGSPGSGTRQTVTRVLGELGMEAGAFARLDESSPAAALERLEKGEIDAVIAITSAPWTQLQVASLRFAVRIVPVDATVVTKLGANVHGLVPLTIPARTYREQEDEVRTVAATALLVSSDAVPGPIVSGALDFLYASADTGSVSASRLSRERALTGITIPLHEGAALYFGRSPAPQ